MARVFVESGIIAINCDVAQWKLPKKTSSPGHSPKCRIVDLVHTKDCLEPLVNVIEKDRRIKTENLGGQAVYSVGSFSVTL